MTVLADGQVAMTRPADPISIDGAKGLDPVSKLAALFWSKKACLCLRCCCRTSSAYLVWSQANQLVYSLGQGKVSPRLTAAIPMDNPHCSCKLTRVRTGRDARAGRGGRRQVSHGSQLQSLRRTPVAAAGSHEPEPTPALRRWRRSPR